MADHRIFPHGGFEPLVDGVWRLKGGLAMPLYRNMIIVRLAGGDLLLHSVVALDEPGLLALGALGRPAYAIVPNVSHQLDTSFYRERYPDLKILAPRISLAAIAKRGRVDGTVEEVLPPLGFKLHLAPATKDPEYAYEYALPSGGRMVMLSDLLSGPDSEDSSKAMGRLLMRFAGPPGNRLGIARIYRLLMAKDATAIADFAHRLADIPDLRLITMSHGEPVREDVASALRAV